MAGGTANAMAREENELNAEFAETLRRITQEHRPFGEAQGKQECLCHRRDGKFAD